LVKGQLWIKVNKSTKISQLETNLGNSN